MTHSLSVLDSTVTKNVNSRNAAGHWSQETREDVFQKWLVLGNMKSVAALSGVDYEVVRTWSKSDWWKDMLADTRQAEAVAQDAVLSRVVAKSLETIEDRLENGEKVLNNKTGQIVSKPVSMKDAATVATSLLQRQNIIRKTATEEVVQKDTMTTVLNGLAKEFAKWAKKGREGSPEDVEVVDVESREI